MGSLVITQNVHDAAHYSRSAMLETGSHRAEQSFEHSYRTPSQSSSTRHRSHSRPTSIVASTPRPSSAASSSHNATPSRSGQPRDSASQSGPQDVSPEPNSEPSSRSISDSVPSLTSDASASANTSCPTSVAASSVESQQKIKIKDLKHIQSILDEDTSPFDISRPGSQDAESQAQPPQFEISEMPIGDVIEMVAGLLTKITTTNDKQHHHLHRAVPSGDGGSQQSSSVLAFHGKNVPTITILSYLSRIHRYCPTTYEVFLSLLVYFDRMTEKVNSGLMRNMRRASLSPMEDCEAPQADSKEIAVQDGAGDSKQQLEEDNTPCGEGEPLTAADVDALALAQLFVVDSFNIHRLTIAAVTCASKYFSDVFYTNSRYAKVGQEETMMCMFACANADPRLAAYLW